MLFGNYEFKAIMDFMMITRKDGVCLVLKMSEDDFYIIINGCSLSIFSTNQEKPNLDILLLEEGMFENGNWKMTRRLNGDEVSIICYDKPALLKLKLFSYSNNIK